MPAIPAFRALLASRGLADFMDGTAAAAVVVAAVAVVAMAVDIIERAATLATGKRVAGALPSVGHQDSWRYTPRHT